MIKTLKITRIDSEYDIGRPVERIQLSAGGKLFTITEEFGQLRIHSHGRDIIIRPGCANEVTIDSTLERVVS